MEALARPNPPGREPVMLTLGERIALWRGRLGLTKKQFATEVGISAKQLARYEADLIPPPADVLRRMVDRLGISADYVIGIREEASRVKLPGNRPRPSVIPGGGDSGRKTYVDRPLLALKG
jgi:transcriptional regulator with XRE-family HTH domain